MALILADRVQETTSTVGTGNIVPGGAVAGFRTFASVMATGDTAPVDVFDPVNAVWECGIGTMQSDGSISLAVTSSSNANAALNLASNGGRTFVALLPNAGFLKSYLGAGASASTGFGGVVQYNGTHYTPQYGNPVRLASSPKSGNTVLGFACGPASMSAPPAWNTLSANSADVAYQNMLICGKSVTARGSSRYFGPIGAPGGNSTALAILEVSGFTSFNAFHGAASTPSGTVSSATLPTCSPSSIIVLMFEWENPSSTPTTAVVSLTSGAAFMSEFGNDDLDERGNGSQHGAVMLWCPGSLSGQTVTVTLDQPITGVVYGGVVCTP